MSDAAPFFRRYALPIYGLAGLLFAFEAGVAWLMLHPDVPDSFRAYYIDQTTTCLDQPVPGTYRFGDMLAFGKDSNEATKPVRVCGWEGPAGDGLHAVGTSARLRFVGAAPRGTQILALELAAVTRNDVVEAQRVDVLLDGQKAATLPVDSKQPQRFTLPVPAGALADGRLELELSFPDAVRMGPTDPDTRRRSVKLTAAGIIPG